MSRCQCKCNKRYKVNDIQPITERLILRSRLNGSTQEEGTGELNTANFVAQILAGGKARAKHIVSTERIRSSLPAGTDMNSLANDVFSDGAAEAAVRMGSNVSQNAIQAMQTGFGRSTVVTLPNGQPFDTRLITANPNAHHNNRLPGTGSASSATAPGMLDRLNPDFSNITTDFRDAARGSSLGQQLLQAVIPGTSNSSATAVAAPAAAAAAASTGNGPSAMAEYAQNCSGLGEQTSEEEMLKIAMA